MVQLPEIQQIEKRINELHHLVDVETLAFSEGHGHRMPIYKISFGSKDPAAPVLGLVGGVHGLERIGAQVCVALLNSLSELVLWDQGTQKLLENIRVFFIPTVNPIGILRKTRCNPQGVDLMRNAPVDGVGKQTWLLSGHRYSNKIPWYRGPEDQAMQVESQALVEAVMKEIRHSRLAMTVDFHSGFGFQDRLWFPYAKSTEIFPDISAMHSFKELLDKTYPHHFYRVEPQAKNYTTHGDLWDHLYDEHRKQSQNLYLPLCLEMGSWMWVKKNPWQIFSVEGPYNPLKGHRHQRTLRRHNTLFEFLLRAANSPQAWANLSEEQTHKHAIRAQEIWYNEEQR